MSPITVGPLRRVSAIDVIEGWNLDAQAQEKHGTEMAALETLAGGLNSLYDFVRTWETTRVRPGVFVPFSSQLRVVFSHVGAGENLMHWYATTLCNYVGLVGQLALELGYLADKKQRDAYRTTVGGPVQVFRDKIAAHFARWMHRSYDSEWTRQSSVFPHLCILDGRLAVGGVKFIEKTGGEEEHKEPVSHWILTATHEEHAKRYPYLLLAPPGGGPQDPRGLGSVKMSGNEPQT